MLIAQLRLGFRQQSAFSRTNFLKLSKNAYPTLSTVRCFSANEKAGRSELDRLIENQIEKDEEFFVPKLN